MWVLLGLLSYIDVKDAGLHTDSDSWHSRSKMICMLIQPWDGY